MVTHPLPGQPVPAFDNLFGEDIFPDTHSKPPLAQLAVVSSLPITCYSGKETDTHLITTSFQVVVEGVLADIDDYHN